MYIYEIVDYGKAMYNLYYLINLINVVLSYISIINFTFQSNIYKIRLIIDYQFVSNMNYIITVSTSVIDGIINLCILLIDALAHQPLPFVLVALHSWLLFLSIFFLKLLWDLRSQLFRQMNQPPPPSLMLT